MDLPQASGIYEIRNFTNGKLWIGQSVNIKARCRQHRTDLRLKQSSPHLQSAWDKYGENSFQFSVLELCEVIDLDVKETYWIGFYKSSEREYGYNIERFPQGTGPRSPEFREKLSKVKKGTPCSIKGYKCFYNPQTKQETRSKESLALPWVPGRGPAKLEAVAKRAKANTGKKRTPETCRRIAIGNTGKTWSEETRIILTEFAKQRTDIGRDGHTGRFVSRR